MKEVKFSILVPVYNVEKYLEQCVESLLSQTYEDDYEIILVDDGSTDSSGIICDGYAERFPEKIKVVHKENGGHTSARLEAIKNAIGDYCIFCDSDDYIDNNLLEVIGNTINKYTNLDMVIYSFKYSNNGNISYRKNQLADIETVYEKADKEVLYNALIAGPVITSLCTKAVKTEILKRDNTDYTPYYKYTMAEDLFMSIYLISEAQKIVYINKPLYNYRIDNESVSRSFNPQMIGKKNTIYVYEHFLEYLPNWNMDDEEHLNKLKNRFLGEAMYTFSNFYEKSKNNIERKAVVDFDWDSFLPEDFSVEEVKTNDTYSLMLYKKIKEKNYIFLRFYFLKKAMYKKYKKFKARFVS